MNNKRVTRAASKLQIEKEEDSEEFESLEDEIPEKEELENQQVHSENSNSSTTEGTENFHNTVHSTHTNTESTVVTPSTSTHNSLEIKMTSPNFNIEYFDEIKFSLERWIQRLEGAFTIFKVEDENIKKNYLLHFIGSDNYNLVCDSLIPRKMSDADVTYKTIKEILESHFSPQPLEIAEIYKFHHRVQMEGESIRDYIAALRKMAVNCNFGEYLKSALRNQFVCGVRNRCIKEKLLGTKDLKFDDAMATALNLEIMQKKSAEMTQSSQSVHKVDHSKGNKYRNQVNSNVFSKSIAPKPNSSMQRSSASEKSNPSVKCFRCGGTHYANVCKHIDSFCNSCKTKGHLGKVCQKKGKKETVHLITHDEDSRNEVPVDYIYNVDDIPAKDFLGKFWVDLKLNDVNFKMELDCGSAYSIVGFKDFSSLNIMTDIIPTDLCLKSYTDDFIDLLGYVKVDVDLLNSQTVVNSKSLRLLIAKDESRKPLFGREWIRAFKGVPFIDAAYKIQNQTISSVSETLPQNPVVVFKLEDLLQKYDFLFRDDCGVIQGEPAAIELKEEARPVFLRARPAPFALREQIEAEIDSLVKEGILVPVDHSAWATPIVPVVKSNGKIRLCGDFKTTLNKHLVVDEHPLPTTDEMFAVLNGGQKFSRIDLRKAYLQWCVREEDQTKLTLSTHKGLFKCTRLLFGLSCAPAKWQRKIESILSGIEGVVVFIDDICVTGPTDDIHLSRLQQVFERLSKYGLRINQSKTDLFCDSVEYCGYKIDRNGIHKTKSKIEAILDAPRPTNVSEVRSFLGLINYYGRFFENLSDLLEPLHNLIRKNTTFKWTEECEKSFSAVKKEMSSEKFLVHYDKNLPLVLATDASPIGVGAVLSHVYPDGSERPIYFASQTLSTTQRKWSQIDKEAYAIIFGIKRFHQFLYGRSFILYTDHKPLVQIFSQDKGLPHMSAMRMQHYAIFLQGFRYNIKYKRSEENANADAFSRLPIQYEEPSLLEEADAFEINQISTMPVSAERIAEETKKDVSLAKLLDALENGTELDANFRFGVKQEEFSLQNGCIMRGIRVVIPETLRREVLKDLHYAHFGSTRMKELARSFCWWGGIDKSIEQLSSDCKDCAEHRSNPKKVTTHHWEYPKKPFERIHCDYAGPFLGVYFFICVDAFSKWPEVHILKEISTESTIPILQSIFASFGLPVKIITDNGAQFTSHKFQEFCKSNGIIHKRSAPFHPASNGQAERYVQIIKSKLKCLLNSSDNLHVKLQNVLTHYRITPHPVTGKSPADSIFNYSVRSKFSLMIPEEKALKPNDIKDKEMLKEFSKGERVAVREYSGRCKWNFGKISERLGKLHYNVILDDGRNWHRHVDQIVKSGVHIENSDNKDEEENLLGFDNSTDHHPVSRTNDIRKSNRIPKKKRFDNFVSN